MKCLRRYSLKCHLRYSLTSARKDRELEPRRMGAVDGEQKGGKRRGVLKEGGNRERNTKYYFFFNYQVLKCFENNNPKCYLA